jgi:hypothetical protein
MIQYFIMLLETIDSLFQQYEIVVLTIITYKFLQDGRNDATNSIYVRPRLLVYNI